MNVFLDANILIAVLNKEYPLFSYASRILSLHEKDGFNLFTSPLCLAISFYFAGKKSGEKIANKKIKLLASHINIAETGRDTIIKTIQNKKIHDFEDGLEYYSAIQAGCQLIVTENTEDFYFSEIKLMTCSQFFKEVAGIKK
ncbi:MAG: PIN domain-containing protein [Bacteroidales bacterium]|nr:PIN domain-containing protein [Bacteroidales bacterium]